MSAINKALSDIAKKNSPSELTKAEVPHVSRSKPWLWLMTGFSLSLAVGGWAVSQAPALPEETGQALSNVNTLVAKKSKSEGQVVHSPTNKTTPETHRVVYTKPAIKNPTENAGSQQSQTSLLVGQVHADNVGEVNTEMVSTTARQLRRVVESAEPDSMTDEPILIAQVTSAKNQPLSALESESSMRVEQVELTHQQLAGKAISRAEKAIEANDIERALSAYREALRYDSRNTETRQKLAALYFGKGDTRKAYEIIQEGISLDTNNQTLRLALSKLLVKAEQPNAALSPLVHLPPMPSREYLAMRAALAQKQKQNDIALESYQLLTQRDPENARWWLGLAIQQERALNFTAAIRSYQNASSKVGISNQSQAFIRDRLTLLEQLEEAQ